MALLVWELFLKQRIVTHLEIKDFKSIAYYIMDREDRLRGISESAKTHAWHFLVGYQHDVTRPRPFSSTTFLDVYFTFFYPSKVPWLGKKFHLPTKVEQATKRRDIAEGVVSAAPTKLTFFLIWVFFLSLFSSLIGRLILPPPSPSFLLGIKSVWDDTMYFHSKGESRLRSGGFDSGVVVSQL